MRAHAALPLRTQRLIGKGGLAPGNARVRSNPGARERGVSKTPAAICVEEGRNCVGREALSSRIINQLFFDTLSANHPSVNERGDRT